MKEWYENGEKWYPSKWGKEDQLGTLNLLGPEKILEAASLIRKGKAYNLSHTLKNGIPGRYSSHGHFFHTVAQRVYDSRPPYRENTVNKLGGSVSRLETTDHVGTHLDSLNHISFNNRFYNGLDAFEETTTFGTYRLGIETVPPIITRGIMIMAPGSEDGITGRGHAITVEETEAFLKKHDLEVREGDAVLFHTGVASLWEKTQEYNSYYENAPGIGYELAKWLADKDVAVTGADTPDTEVEPPERKGTRLPVHQYLITKSGLRILDNLNLGELARDKVYEFFFACLPLKIYGSTASPVAPVALT